MKNLHIALDSEQHRKLKILAALRETSIAEIVRTALSRAMEPMPLHIPQPPALHIPQPPALHIPQPPALHTRTLETV